jgi:flagellar biosynthesis regulator FlaF
VCESVNEGKEKRKVKLDRSLHFLQSSWSEQPRTSSVKEASYIHQELWIPFISKQLFFFILVLLILFSKPLLFNVYSI